MKQTNSWLIILIKFIVFSCFVQNAFLYLLACCTPYIPSNYLSFLSLLSLAFPFLLFGMMGWLFISFFIKRKWSVAIVVLLLLGYKNIGSLIALNSSENFNYKKQKNSLRILSWNIQEFGGIVVKSVDTPNSKRSRIIEVLKKYDADIICFQDFIEGGSHDGFINSFSQFDKELGYKYSYFMPDRVEGEKDQVIKTGTCIFSKNAILKKGKNSFTVGEVYEGLSFIDINYFDTTIRIFNAHLQSMKLNHKEDLEPTLETSTFSDVNNIYKLKLQKIQHFDTIHIQQAKEIKEQLNKCPLPFVFCGDLNSTSNSYVYHLLHENLKDVFLEKGFGFGKTYNSSSIPFLRIDVMMIHSSLKLNQFTSNDIKTSDHYPLIADISLSK